MLKKFFLYFVVFSCFALEDPGAQLRVAGLTTKLGSQLDGKLEFTSSEGVKANLETIIGKKTTILVPAYYGCPRLCGLVLEGVTKLIGNLQLNLGTDFQVVAVSFDPEDTVENAKNFREKYLGLITQEHKESFQFFIGEEKNIVPLMKTLGFGYVKDRGEFAHSAAIFMISPGGVLSQYFTGIVFPELDVRLALVEASKGSIGSLVEHAMLFCFRFDETKGKYTLFAFNFMRVGAVLTLCGLIWLFISLKRKEKGS